MKPNFCIKLALRLDGEVRLAAALTISDTSNGALEVDEADEEVNSEYGDIEVPFTDWF